MPKNTNEEVITCNDPNIKGEKIVKIPLDKEQRVALLKAILFSNSKHKCLMPIIDILEKHVRKENEDEYDKICWRVEVMGKSEL